MKNQIISAWKELAKNKKITARNTLTYILLRADGPTEALIKIRQAFSPIKSPIKLANGRRSFDCLVNEENYLLGYSLQSWASKANVNKDIANRFQEFGIEATPEQIDDFRETYIECMKKLGF